MIHSDAIRALTREFRTATGSDNDLKLHLGLVLEEAVELIEAATALPETPSDLTVEHIAHFLKEAGDFVYTSNSFMDIMDSSEQEALEEVMDFLDDSGFGELSKGADQILGITLRTMGIQFDIILSETIARIHESNMTKIGPDGTVTRDDSGKVLKGPHYLPPYLDDLAAEFLASGADNDLAA